MSLILKRIMPDSQKILLFHRNDHLRNFPLVYIVHRNINIIPSVYNGEQDPAVKFFSPNVQALLKRLTRPDFQKVFRKRNNRSHEVLKTPKYKFLTTEELEVEVARAQRRADQLLQMPPVVKTSNPIDEVLSRDPALSGAEKSKYVFTDISFGVDNAHRIIVERDIDGTLRSSDHETRKRLNQAYFPIVGRKIKEPIMFTDREQLHSLLDAEKYEFVLDRACLQYEPDEPSYQNVTSTTYQHIDAKRKYNVLRSTRHFGPLVFYLTWHRSMDGLLLEMLQTGFIREAVCLVAVRHDLHGDVVPGNQLSSLSANVLSTEAQLSSPETLSEEDIQLDEKCTECIEQYIANNSAMKSHQELALQGFRESHRQLIDLSRGLRKAHGSA